MPESLDASLVRIRTAAGHVVGAGFLVGESQVLTCAHVINQALGLVESASDPPQDVVTLDFPLIAPRTLYTAKIVRWCPPLANGHGDIAGLELQDTPPARAEIVRFASAEDVWGHEFRAFGFPTGYDDGVWATGRLLARQATDWVMIEDVKKQGFTVAHGFSGTPLWDTKAKGVVGMVVAASRPTEGTKTAFVIPPDVLAAAWPLIAVPQREPRNPYKGLSAFTLDDVGDFFGREQAIKELVNLVKVQTTEQPATVIPRLLTIIGQSGSGKSSLVMAGLLPQLQDGALSGSKEWVYLGPMVPGKHPIEALILTLATQMPDRGFESLQKDLKQDDARGLHQMATLLVNQHKGKHPATRVLLLVDQFEELFTQVETEEERKRFIKLLLTACSEPRGPLLVLLTMRADFYDRPMHYPKLFYLIDNQHYPLLSMEVNSLRRVIEQPAKLPKVSLTFEGDLVNQLLSEVQGQIGALPLLQFTLDQLFQHRQGHQLTLSAYHEMGGVKGALSKRAEDTYVALPSEQHRKLACALFLRLVNPAMIEQDTTRRRALRSEFILDDSTQMRLLQDVANAFITARLLTTNEIAGTTTIEVSHEALIREWPRLANWRHDARDDIHLQQTITEDTIRWERHNKHKDRLYRGSQLKEARAWISRNTSSSSEAAFLHAGLRAYTEQRLRYVVIGMAIILLSLSMTGLVYWLLTRPDPTTLVSNLQDNNNLGSLRYAINNAPPGSKIKFDSSVHGTILLLSGDLNIARDLTILGPDRGIISISSESGYIVHIAPRVTATIFGLTFKGSKTTNNSFISSDGTLTISNSTISGNTTVYGGGIYNDGTLMISNSTISGNTAIYGGGIYSDGTLTISNSTISGNAAVYGGGIYSNETLTISNSIISGNAATDGGRYGGGGIYSNGTLMVSNSTISGNAANSNGGGGIFCGANSTNEISNSTISGNTAIYGGGIYSSSIGILTISNSTISGNTANNGGGIFIQSYSEDKSNLYLVQVDLIFSTIYGNTAPSGGDIAIEDFAYNSSNGGETIKQVSQVKIRNSIVAGDLADPSPDIVGMLTSYGYNLFQDNSSATFDSATRVLHNTDKVLSANDLPKVFVPSVRLQDNGGPTKTLALASDSLAVDQIPPAACHITNIYGTPVAPETIITDQRGMKRPDNDKSNCDIGAYEYTGASS